MDERLKFIARLIESSLQAGVFLKWRAWTKPMRWRSVSIPAKQSWRLREI